MAIRTLGLLAVVGIVLSSCQSMNLTQSASCNEQQCHVKVTVNDCNVTLDPDIIKITRPRVEIHWDIATADYTFTSDGIVVQNDSRNEFSGGHLSEQGRKFTLNDKNSFRNEYKYVVKVKRGEVACRPLDPSIVNN